MQSAAPEQLKQVTPRPTWRNYNQTVLQRTREELQREELQLYVDRQKELASTQATAPLQQLIADLNKLATDQQAQIEEQDFLRLVEEGAQKRMGSVSQ